MALGTGRQKRHEEISGRFQPVALAVGVLVILTSCRSSTEPIGFLGRPAITAVPLTPTVVSPLPSTSSTPVGSGPSRVATTPKGTAGQLPPPSTITSTTSRTSSGTGAGVLPGEHRGWLRIRPDLSTCALWENELAEPPADAPPSYPETLRVRLTQEGCPGYGN